MKRIGYIDGRRIKFVQGGVTQLAIHSWGVIIGGVAGSMSLYLAADYGAYLNSYAAGRLEVCASTSVRMRVGGKGFEVDATGKILTAYGILCTGPISFGETGELHLQKFAGELAGVEGLLWYDTNSDKLMFRTEVGYETVNSA
ncbi:hypothetical protein ES703_67261 [subsurface metagenome]